MSEMLPERTYSSVQPPELSTLADALRYPAVPLLDMPVHFGFEPTNDILNDQTALVTIYKKTGIVPDLLLDTHISRCTDYYYSSTSGYQLSEARLAISQGLDMYVAALLQRTGHPLDCIKVLEQIRSDIYISQDTRFLGYIESAIQEITLEYKNTPATGSNPAHSVAA